MDEIVHDNIQRWKALAKANALFSRPYLNLDVASALAYVLGVVSPSRFVKT